VIRGFACRKGDGDLTLVALSSLLLCYLDLLIIIIFFSFFFFFFLPSGVVNAEKKYFR
jgi:hypothetical protein